MKRHQITLRANDEQKALIDKAKVLIEVVDGKSYNRKEALLRIFEKFLKDYSGNMPKSQKQ